jgi:hypothetical protein
MLPTVTTRDQIRKVIVDHMGELMDADECTDGIMAVITKARAGVFERCAIIAETFGVGREKSDYSGDDIAVRIRAAAVDYKEK